MPLHLTPPDFACDDQFDDQRRYREAIEQATRRETIEAIARQAESMACEIRKLARRFRDHNELQGPARVRAETLEAFAQAIRRDVADVVVSPVVPEAQKDNADG